MIEINIPGVGLLKLEHLVMDVNGTLALDGVLLDGVREALESLRGKLTLHLLTADTHGKQDVIDEILDLKAVRLRGGNEVEQKADYVCRLGTRFVVAIGQGANDAGMLSEAALGICVLSPEGTAVSTFNAADLVVSDVLTAFALLENPQRIKASLRQ